MFALPDVTDIVAAALAEDLGVDAAGFLPGAAGNTALLDRDVTSSSVVEAGAHFGGRIVCREEAVVAGLPLVAAVFDALSSAAGLFDPIDVFPLVAEGTRVRPGTPVAEVSGVATAVLAGERTALDLLMLLSGIATETAGWVAEAGPSLAVCDTRKTLPGLRALSKYAVLVGGGVNHRAGLYDMVLIKDNHIAAAGGVEAAVASARDAHPDLVVQAEADTVEQAVEAVVAGAHMVLLDNMDDATLTEAVSAVRVAAAKAGRHVTTEASGGITRDRLRALRATGVDRVSTSALTMTVRPVDFGFDEAGA